MRKSANSAAGGSRCSAPVTPNEVSNPWRPPASVTSWLMEATSPRSSSMEGRNPWAMDRSSLTALSTRVRSSATGRCTAAGVPRKGPEVDLAAEVDEGLDRPVVELLGDVAAFFLLAEHDPGRVRLHQVVATGLGGDVLEDHLHSPVVRRPAHRGHCRSVEHRLSVDFEGNRLDPFRTDGSVPSSSDAGPAISGSAPGRRHRRRSCPPGEPGWARPTR